ncbi:hypothetical protein PR048_017577 [Dryococelus australis]|uniref:Uncharacterized protein n=1 Tax=Dryococelus australis TaxID=614101 RepID=A0ABQ9H9Z3_9NEOP|nr:hypothetical protein PR048_017577 [Dryococelus australis]
MSQEKEKTTVNPLHETKLTTKHETLITEQHISTDGIELEHGTTTTEGKITHTTEEHTTIPTSEGKKEQLTTIAQSIEKTEKTPTTIRQEFHEYSSEAAKQEMPATTEMAGMEHETKFKPEKETSVSEMPEHEKVTEPAKGITSTTGKQPEITTSESEEVGITQQITTEHTEAGKAEMPGITKQPEIENVTHYEKTEKPTGTVIPSQEHVREPEKTSAPGVTEQATEIKHEEKPATTQKSVEEQATAGPTFEVSGSTVHPEIEHFTHHEEVEKPTETPVPSHELVTEPEKVSAPGVTEQPTGIEHEETLVSTEQIMEGEITEGPKLEAPGITEQAEIEHVTPHEEVEKPTGTAVPSHELVTEHEKVSAPGVQNDLLELNMKDTSFN